jgi:hypothetical protein
VIEGDDLREMLSASVMPDEHSVAA